MSTIRRIAVFAFAIATLTLCPIAQAETLPKGFPFAACPGGTLVESSDNSAAQIAEYTTTESAKQISEFYTQDLKAKGWTLTSGGMQTSDYSVLRATKQSDKVAFHISLDPRIHLTRARIVLLFHPE
jgi:hypothetical protein